jgi:biotin synthase-related radical SAM superfamily protein
MIDPTLWRAYAKDKNGKSVDVMIGRIAEIADFAQKYRATCHVVITEPLERDDKDLPELIAIGVEQHHPFAPV